MFDHVSQRSVGLSDLAKEHDALALPKRPKLIKDLTCLVVDDTVVVVGLEKPLRLSGSGMMDAASLVIPLLDGRRSASDIATAFDADIAGNILSFLHLLHLEGMIEDAAAPETDTPLAHYFSRHLGVTASSSAGGQAARRARKDGVSLPPELQAFTAQIIDAGLRIADSAADAALDIRCEAGGRAPTRPTLYLDASTGRVGPLVLPGDTACPDCARHTVGSNAKRVAMAALIPFAVTEAQCHLSRVFRPRTLDGVLMIRSGDVIPNWQKVVRLSECPTCGDPSLGQDQARVLTTHYATAIRRWMPQEPAGFRLHIAPRTQALVTDAAAGPSTSNIPAASINHPLLDLCRPIAGFAQRANGKYWRVIASAGNLGSAEMLLAGEQGQYYPYIGSNHTLGQPMALPCRADIVIRVNNHRVAAKYGWRSYLYSHLDAGVMAARASRVLATAGHAHWIDTTAVQGTGDVDHLHPLTLSLTKPEARVPAPIAGGAAGDLAALGRDMAQALEQSGGTVSFVAETAPEPGLGTLVSRRESGGIKRGILRHDAFQHLVTAAAQSAPWHGPDDLTKLMLVRDVRGIADGLYRIGATGEPEQIGKPDMDVILSDALLQTEHGRGHVFLFIGADLSLAKQAIESYKAALLGAGWIVDHLCLTATKAGLPATPTGGFPPLVLRERLAPFVPRFDPIVGFVVGGA